MTGNFHVKGDYYIFSTGKTVPFSTYVEVNAGDYDHDSGFLEDETDRLIQERVGDYITKQIGANIEFELNIKSWTQI